MLVEIGLEAGALLLRSNRADAVENPVRQTHIFCILPGITPACTGRKIGGYSSLTHGDIGLASFDGPRRCLHSCPLFGTQSGPGRLAIQKVLFETMAKIHHVGATRSSFGLSCFISCMYKQDGIPCQMDVVLYSRSGIA